MHPIYKYCLLILLSLTLTANSAWASTYKVQVRQNYPAQASADATCTLETKICFLTLLQNPDEPDPQYIDVAIKFSGDAIYFQFMQNRKYLSTAETWRENFELTLDKNRHSTGNVSLYIPHSEEDPNSMVINPVVLVSNMKVADLEISVQPE